MPTKRPVAAVFIHGLAKKPAPEKLQELWLWALGRDNPMPTVFPPPNRGLDFGSRGVPHRLNYYADVFYGTEYETDLDSSYEANESLEIAAEGLDRVEAELPPPAAGDAARAGVPSRLRGQAQCAGGITPEPAIAVAVPLPADASTYEIASWLPGPVKRAIVHKAAMEAFYFLFNKEFVRSDGTRFMVRQELRSRLLKDLSALQSLGEKLVIVSHSMGTMVAYDVLRNCPECPPVDTLITLGSPLGVREVQQELIAADADDVDFPAATLNRWINVYDPLDPICGADPKLANDYREVHGKRVTDVKESNWGRWRHTITHYLAGTALRSQLNQVLS